jgi:hypothetical protein
MVKNGLLNEKNNYYLSLEKALGIIVVTQSRIHGIENKMKLKKHMPIAIDKVEYGIKYNRSYIIFSDRILHEKGQKSGPSIHYSFTNEDRKLIHKLSHEAALQDKLPESNVHYVGLDEQETLLRDAIAVLKHKSNVIDETILPDEDNYGRSGYRIDNFTDKTLEHALGRLFSLFLNEYKILIEFNFPTLKELFELYRKMPVQLFVVIYPNNVNSDWPRKIDLYWNFDYKQSENKVAVCASTDISFDDHLFTLNYQRKTFKIDKVESHFSFLTSALINGHYLCKESPSLLNIQYIDSEFLILRDLVYKQISHELPDVLTKLYGQYSLEFWGHNA